MAGKEEDQKKVGLSTIENDMRAAGVFVGDVEDRDNCSG